MKKYTSLILCFILVFVLFSFSACKDKDENNELPTLTDEQISEMAITVDVNSLSNFSDTVANLSVKTNINNYKSSIDYLDKLRLQGAAMLQIIEKEKIEGLAGLEEFNASLETLNGLWSKAEQAAAKYVKGFYTAVGEKEVTAVYCYMTVNYTAEKGNTYVFALTYNEGETPVSVYMNATTTSDIVETSVYEAAPDKFYASECSNDMMNTVKYHNITLDLADVLAAAK